MYLKCYFFGYVREAREDGLVFDFTSADFSISLFFFPLLRHLQLTVGRVGPFIFSFFLREVPVGYNRLVVFFSNKVFVKFQQRSTIYKASLV